MGLDVIFEESAARRGVESVPLAHLSIELGHLYIEEFADLDARLGGAGRNPRELRRQRQVVDLPLRRKHADQRVVRRLCNGGFG